MSTACQAGKKRNLFGTDEGSAPTEILSSCHVLSGLPITRALNVQSPATHVKDAVCWLWGRKHITRDDVSVCMGGTKQPMLESEVDGQLLMYVQPCAPRVRFAFSVDEYVLGDLEILVQGVPIKVFVNAGDSLILEQLREHPTTAGSIGKKKAIIQNLGGGMLTALSWLGGRRTTPRHSHTRGQAGCLLIVCSFKRLSAFNEQSSSTSVPARWFVGTNRACMHPRMHARTSARTAARVPYVTVKCRESDKKG